MDSLSVDDLFGNLKQVIAKEKSFQNDERDASSTFGQSDDVVSVDINERSAEFERIEKNLKRLPKMQTSFDVLATKNSGVKGVTRVDDPIYILQSRKKSDKVKPESATDKWFTLPKTELTNDVKRDLMLIKHRAALDPKRHYKKEKWTLPERFSIGTIIEGPTEFYSSRLSNKQRKGTMLGTLMADDNVNKYFKRKYTEVQEHKTSGKKSHYRAVKDKRRKF